MAPPVADDHREDLTVGRSFWKMSGSGNDFVVFDSRHFESGDDAWERPEAIRALCARGTGVGADGVVFVTSAELAGATLAMRYYNSDGSRGAFCGNATLCVTRLARELDAANAGELALQTDSGLVPARVGKYGPEIDLPPVHEISSDVTQLPRMPGERRIGFAVAGVPHIVVRCEDVDLVPVETRGRELRHSGFPQEGANVNFLSHRAGQWSIRTFERGVEGETLACGSGAIASAILLATWKESGASTSLRTRSGFMLTVRSSRDGESWRPSLAGEGRVVFTGELSDVASG
ncbi:MAG: diaminopimelate epimerase [Gemmatimonadota bacterium]